MQLNFAMDTEINYSIHNKINSSKSQKLSKIAKKITKCTLTLKCLCIYNIFKLVLFDLKHKLLHPCALYVAT